MRKLVTYCIVLSVLIVQGCHSTSAPSSSSHLTLSNEHPAAGEKVTFTYDTTGTLLAGKTTIEATVYTFDKIENAAEVIDLQTDGKLFKGAFTVPATAKTIALKISNGGEVIDNNKGKGYLYLVYKGDKPVEGAYAAEADVYSGFGRSLQINVDKDLSLSLYKKEFALYPNNNDKNMYIAMLANTKVPANIALATQITTALAKSGNEHDMITASYAYANLNRQASADSLKAVIKKKFPDGEFVKRTAQSAIWMEQDPVKKEALYNALIKKYPEANEKNGIYDKLRSDIAAAYISKGDLKSFYRIEALIKDKSEMPYALNEKAWQWVLKGKNLTDAQRLSKLSLDLITENINNKKLHRTIGVTKYLNSQYNEYADTYALIIFKLGQPAEALKMQQAIMDSEKHPIPEFYEHYALYLQAAGQTQKAIGVIENAVKGGQDNEAMIANLKAMYVKEKGSDKGYATYFAGLKQVTFEKLRALLVKDLINEPAPDFKLNDINGNTVSLASLKGKVVIVDFWATWCGPCKASLPGMQIAVNKFKNNPNVKFLFIDTREEGDFLPVVKKFIATNKYNFTVLIDGKDKNGKMMQVLNAYKVDGIPTKFIIDGSGHIRFKKVGFDGSVTALADEVSTMIDIAAHPQANNTGATASLSKYSAKGI